MTNTGLETSDEYCFVYATFPDEVTANTIARVLLDKRLIACANIQAPMTSIYMWQGKREEGTEVAAFFKTRRRLAPALIAAARALHPYTVPCFLVLPIEGGNGDYLAWARAQLS